MNAIDFDTWLTYWSAPHLQANAMILLNIVGALLLGMIVGYERSYHGRAAGMRTYGMVCMGSAAVTVIIGYPQYWFGGLLPLAASADFCSAARWWDRRRVVPTSRRGHRRHHRCSPL